jgi:hypothetical protein
VLFRYTVRRRIGQDDGVISGSLIVIKMQAARVRGALLRPARGIVIVED